MPKLANWFHPTSRWRSHRRANSFSDRFAGQIAVVTGASAGLGRQICLDLAKAGAIVVGVARRLPELASLEAELKASSPRSFTVACDVANTDELVALVSDVESRFGRIDILCNNAGMDPGIRLARITVADFRRTYDVNVFAPVAATLAVLPGMFARGSGIIVNVSSDGGRLPSPGPGAYPSSKAALSAFTESISYRTIPRGVSVHVVYPAWMPTEMGIAALGRGLRRPPRFARRSVASVSAQVLSSMGKKRMEISASSAVTVAHAIWTLAPGTFRRARLRWETQTKSKSAAQTDHSPPDTSNIPQLQSTVLATGFSIPMRSVTSHSQEADNHQLRRGATHP